MRGRGSQSAMSAASISWRCIALAALALALALPARGQIGEFPTAATTAGAATPTADGTVSMDSSKRKRASSSSSSSSEASTTSSLLDMLLGGGASATPSPAAADPVATPAAAATPVAEPAAASPSPAARELPAASLKSPQPDKASPSPDPVPSPSPSPSPVAEAAAPASPAATPAADPSAVTYAPIGALTGDPTPVAEPSPSPVAEPSPSPVAEPSPSPAPVEVSPSPVTDGTLLLPTASPSASPSLLGGEGAITAPVPTAAPSPATVVPSAPAVLPTGVTAAPTITKPVPGYPPTPDLPPSPPESWKTLEADTAIVFDIEIRGPYIVPFTSPKAYIVGKTLRDRYLRSCQPSDITVLTMHTFTYLSYDTPTFSTAGGSRRLLQTEKSGAELKIVVRTNVIRVDSELQSVMDGIDSGKFATDLTFAGVKTDNATMLQSPDTMPLDDLPDPNENTSKGGLPIWAIAIICTIVLVIVPVPAYCMIKWRKRKHKEAIAQQAAEMAAARARMQSRIIKPGGKSFTMLAGQNHHIMVRAGSVGGMSFSRQGSMAPGGDGVSRQGSMTSLPSTRGGPVSHPPGRSAGGPSPHRHFTNNNN